MLGTQEELAVLGGPAAVTEGAIQPWPQVTAVDKEAVMGVLERSGRCTWARGIVS